MYFLGRGRLELGEPGWQVHLLLLLLSISHCSSVCAGNFDQVEVDKFVEESLKMSRFKHAHVMELVGVCLDADSAPYIIMPYMANGSLLKWLRSERKSIVLTEEADEDEVQLCGTSHPLRYFEKCDLMCFQ